jgi:hypothetical protein
VCIIAIFITITVIIQLKHESTDYLNNLATVFDNAQEIQVSEAFNFDFDRAYVFNDCYISGDGFALAYGLDLSISEVGPGTSENIHRIVFVDKNGNFIYEFQYDINEVNFDNEGVIVYPDTRIILCDPLIPGAITLHFETAEYYTDNAVTP